MPKSDLPIPGEYAPVADRIQLFYERFPKGQILSRLVSRRGGEVTFMARVYRDPCDIRPSATGWASERIGDGEVNSVACVDHVKGLISSSAAVVNQYSYGPFGESIGSTETVPNVLRFGSREYDGETGLYHHRTRYYDPQIARFISEDPIGLAGGMNTYVYAGNDPPNMLDPFGLKQTCIDWYVVSYDRRTGIVLYEVYLYTTCTGDDDAGGGGGDGAPPNPPACKLVNEHPDILRGLHDDWARSFDLSRHSRGRPHEEGSDFIPSGKGYRVSLRPPGDTAGPYPHVHQPPEPGTRYRSHTHVYPPPSPQGPSEKDLTGADLYRALYGVRALLIRAENITTIAYNSKNTITCRNNQKKVVGLPIH